MQFRLRSLFRFVILVAIVLALGMWLTREWRRRVGIGNELKAQGAAWVGFSGPESEAMPAVVFQQPIPDEFNPEERLRSVELKAYDLKPECLSRLSRAGHLDRLSIISCDVCDEDLVTLPIIATDYLLIWNAKVTDASISDIAAVKGLNRLVLYKTEITRQGLQELRRRLPHVDVVFRP